MQRPKIRTIEENMNTRYTLNRKVVLATCSLEAEGGYVRGDEDPIEELRIETRYCGIEVADALREKSC
jgi:hypothetical protein